MIGQGIKKEGAWDVFSDLGSRVDGSAKWMTGEHRLRSRFGEGAAWSFSAVLSEVLGDAQGNWVWGTDVQRTDTADVIMKLKLE